MKHSANLYSEDIDVKPKADKETESASLARDGKPDKENQFNRVIDGVVNAAPNDNPYKRRITNGGGGWLARIIRRLKNRVNPPPTAEEIAAMEDKKRSAMLASVLRNEARVAAPRLQNSLADLGFCYTRRDMAGNIVKRRMIQFDQVYSSEDAHWLHVNMNKWVPGVNSDELIKQEVINHLSRSVGHKVNVRATAEDGIWYIIERASGMMGIPSHVQITDMLQRFPSTSTGLTIPMGMTNNRKPIFDNLDDMVHVLVAGQTGGGKSNFQNVIITTLASRNPPERVRFILFDMKAGLEFQYYEGLPHLMAVPGVSETGIITKPDLVAPALKWIVETETESRLSKIGAAGHKDIKRYNSHRRKDQLPVIVVVIDEWAMVKLSDGGKDAEIQLAKAVQLLRAAGIHFVIGTQTPSKDVLGVLVRANLPTRLAFSCAELSASMLIVGDGSAVGLGAAGRCVVKRSASTPVQTPYISEDMVKAIVERIKSGEINEALPLSKHDVTVTEMLEWALHHNSGSLRYQNIFDHFSSRGIARAEVQNILAGLENKEVMVGEHAYIVVPGAGSRPRKLVSVESVNNG